MYCQTYCTNLAYSYIFLFFLWSFNIYIETFAFLLKTNFDLVQMFKCWKMNLRFNFFLEPLHTKHTFLIGTLSYFTRLLDVFVVLWTRRRLICHFYYSAKFTKNVSYSLPRTAGGTFTVNASHWTRRARVKDFWLGGLVYVGMELMFSCLVYCRPFCHLTQVQYVCSSNVVFRFYTCYFTTASIL